MASQPMVIQASPTLQPEHLEVVHGRADGASAGFEGWGLIAADQQPPDGLEDALRMRIMEICNVEATTASRNAHGLATKRSSTPRLSGTPIGSSTTRIPMGTTTTSLTR